MYRAYLKQHPEMKTIVARVKELFLAAKQSPSEMSKLIDTYLIPQESEKKQHAEVSTPYSLRQEMLDSVPQEFWTSPKKIFEPCCGKGGFVLDVVNRFMTGLQVFEPNEKKRYKHIVEECIYFADINPVNIFVTKLLLDPKEEYALQYHEGDTLQLSVIEKWDLEGFDLVVGNPPYQPFSNGKKGGKSLWPEFVRYAIRYTIKNGYVLYVHPALWRKPENELHDLMFSKQILRLSIHDDKESDKIFNATTRYDWYILQNKEAETHTIVSFDDKTSSEINIRPSLPYISNHGMNILLKLQKKGLEVGFLQAYQTCEGHTQKKYVKREKDEQHRYPLLNASSAKNGIVYYWSTKPLECQSIRKVVFSNGRHITPFYDEGKLGMTQGGIYIPVSNSSEGNVLCRYLQSKLVKYIIAATKWSNFETNRQVFSLLPNPYKLSCIFSDEELYSFIDLSKEERTQIEHDQKIGLDQYIPLYSI